MGLLCFGCNALFLPLDVTKAHKPDFSNVRRKMAGHPWCQLIVLFYHQRSADPSHPITSVVLTNNQSFISFFEKWHCAILKVPFISFVRDQSGWAQSSPNFPAFKPVSATINLNSASIKGWNFHTKGTVSGVLSEVRGKYFYGIKKRIAYVIYLQHWKIAYLIYATKKSRLNLFLRLVYLVFF